MLRALQASIRLSALSKIARPISTPPSSSPAVQITRQCVDRIKQLANERNKYLALRVNVDGGGCSGFQYGFELEDWEKKPQASLLKEEENLFEKDGAFVIVDNISLVYLSGSKIDYSQELISSSFRISENPNSESSCGCGVSFSPKE